jgi:beta-phosphoglucomutase-like phosphatase (HAD superfamily)
LPRIAKPDFVVFDFDGVLADTDHAWFSVVAEELAAEGVETTADALLVEHRGKVIDASARDFERDYSIVLPDDWTGILHVGSSQPENYVSDQFRMHSACI